MSDSPRNRSRPLTRVASFVGNARTSLLAKFRNVFSPMDTSPQIITPPDLPPRPHSVPLGEVDSRLLEEKAKEFDLGDGVPRQLQVRTTEAPFVLSDGTPCIVTSHTPMLPAQGTLEYITRFIDITQATATIAAAKSQSTNAPALGIYGEAARRRDPTGVDQAREELLDLLHLVVRPFVCLTESTNEYGVQYKRMGDTIGKPIRSAINNLTDYAKNKVSPNERWYKQNLLSSVLATGAMDRFPLDSTVNARIPDQANHMTLEAWCGLPGVPNVSDDAIGELVSVMWQHGLDLSEIRLTRNNTLTEHWNAGWNLRQIFNDSVKGTYNDANYGPDRISCTTAMQYLDRIGYLDYLVEQAMTRFSNIVEAGIAPVPSADYLLRALRHSVDRSEFSKEIQEFSLFFSRTRLIAAQSDSAALHPRMFPTVDLQGEFPGLSASSTELSPAHATVVEISRRLRHATSRPIDKIKSFTTFSPSELEKIAAEGFEAQINGAPYSPIRQNASEGITTRHFAFVTSVAGSRKEQHAQVAAELRVDIKKLSEEYERRDRGVSQEPLPPPPARSTTVKGGIDAIARMFESFANDPKTPRRLEMAFRVVKELQGGPKEGEGDKKHYGTFSLHLAMSDKSRSTARALKNMNLLGTPLGLEFIQNTLLFLALSLVFPNLNALVTVQDAYFQDLYDRGCAINKLNRVVGSEIIKDVHGAMIAFGLYSTKDISMKNRNTIPPDIKEAVGQIDPRYYPFLIDQQGGACMMHQFCERSLVYNPRQRPLHDLSDRAIGVGVSETRTTLGAMVLNDKLPLGHAYPCLIKLFGYTFNLSLACLISYFAYLFHWADKFARGKGRLPSGAIGSEAVVALAQILMDQEKIGVVGSEEEEEEEEEGEEMDISRGSVAEGGEASGSRDVEMEE